jgi:L-2-hydroxyglutarate oxidase LhgO
MSPGPRHDVAIVGAGLVGLATARALLQRRPDARVIVLDKEPVVAKHQSSHNSGVIHAGLYYERGSLKAQLCRAGRAALLQFADEHGIPYRLTGKLVVAVDEHELGRLEELRHRALANGLRGVRELTAAEMLEVEPHVSGVRALHVPETGVIDFAEVARAYAADVEAKGGELALESEVVAVERRGGSRVLRTRAGHAVDAASIVICAGLQSDRLANLVAPGRREHRIVPFRGDYFRLSPQAAGLVRGLVYPVPDPAFPFLGVHFTRRLDGEVWVGPNAVPALAREHYGRFGLDLRDALDLLSFPGTWRLGRRYYRTGLAEIVRDLVKQAAVRDMRRYLPMLKTSDVNFGPCGIRAQVLGRDGRLVDDFILEESGGVLAVVNAPSPAATASLAIAEQLAAAQAKAAQESRR